MLQIAISISGYSNTAPILSTIIDNLFFALCYEYDDVHDIVEVLFEKHYTLAKNGIYFCIIRKQIL